MMHETLFRETFSQLRASDEAKREVLSMIETRQNRQTRRIGRVVGLAAALIAALAVTAGAVNLFTDGELFHTFSVIWSDGYKMELEDEAGNQTTAYLTNAEVVNTDGRVILQVAGQEIDITQAMEQEGYYRFEEEQMGLVVEVEGDTKHWTVTQSLEEGNISYSFTGGSEESAGASEIKTPDAGAAKKDAADIDA